MRMNVRIEFSDVTLDVDTDASDGHLKANDTLARLSDRITRALELKGLSSHPDSVQITIGLGT